MLEDHGPHTSSSTAPSQPTPPLLQAEGREWVRPLSFRMFLPSSCPSHIWTEYRFPGFLFLSSQKLPMSISKSPFFFWLHYLTSIPSSLLTFFLHQMGLNEFCSFKTLRLAALECLQRGRPFTGSLGCMKMLCGQ